jgi:CubicO group peptidase (beta-lactamase class C family)
VKRFASILLLFLPLLAAAQGRGLNDRITNDLSRLPAMDAVVDSFMTRWSLRGVSLSVMRNDSLVYARGYGRADASKPMTPGTLLRMASVSKLITAVGIMKLQERGKLVLDTPVFGPFGILDGYDEYITDDNYYLITVEHLLRHQAVQVRAVVGKLPHDGGA